MFKYVYKNNKGFTLIEMLVCVALLGFIVPATGALLFQFTNAFNIAITRADIINGIKTASMKIDRNHETFFNAANADIIYDPVIDEGIIIKEDGTFTWKNSRGYPYVIGKEGKVEVNNPYTYIFSTPAYDENGKSLGYRLLIREPGETNTKYYLEAEGQGDSPIKIEFTIAQSNEIFEEGETSIFEKDTYIPNVIKITFKSGLPEISDASTAGYYTFNSMLDGDKINYSLGYLSLNQKWLDNNSIAAAHPAGWVNNTLNIAPDSGYPTNTTAKYFDFNGYSHSVTIDGINKTANVLRFIPADGLPF